MLSSGRDEKGISRYGLIFYAAERDKENHRNLYT
jgi:hypothetical protein